MVNVSHDRKRPESHSQVMKGNVKIGLPRGGQRLRRTNLETKVKWTAEIMRLVRGQTHPF
jgi:hypothetical protein